MGTVPVIIALGGVVLSELHGTGMVSDRTEVTVVPSVLVGSVRRAYSCQSGHIRLGLTSPRPSLGSGRCRGRESLARHVAKAEEGVAADPDLGVRHVLLGLAGPRLFGPLLADVSWAARTAN